MELGRQGIGFLLLGIMAFAYFRKDKALSEAYQKRVDDNNRLAVVIEATNAAAKALEQTSTHRGNIIVAIGETTQAMAESLRALSHSLEQGKAIAEANRTALTQLTLQIQSMHRDIGQLGEDHRAAEKATRVRR